tara:strand:- start:942 stop:1295 length:354 start_codon:yes stop_codon:yes gene_type:complete
MPFQRPPADPSATDHSEGLDKLVVRRHREVCLGFVISALVTFGLQMLVFGVCFQGMTWLGGYLLLTWALYAAVRGFRMGQVIAGHTLRLHSGPPVIAGMVFATACTPFALMALRESV